MKKTTFILAALLSAACISAQETLTLEQCREMALKYNKEMAAAARQTESARYTAKSYKGNFFPNFSLSGTGIYSTSDGSLGIAGGNLPTFLPDATGQFLPNKGFAYFPGIDLNYKIGMVYMDKFKLVSKYKPTGDQPQAIDALVKGVLDGDKEQTLMGVTGSGKTFTMANIIEKINRPTLVLAHNKTLAAQLCSEFREFFPDNAVEYFVSYYDYYQPEAYVPTTDTYIEKDSSINDEIDKLRHSATSALFERRDVIIVASVSCIYSIGDPIDYKSMVISLRSGMEYGRDKLIEKLVSIQYERNDINFVRNKFRVRGDTVEIFPAGSNGTAVRVEFFGDEIDRICEIQPLTGQGRGYSFSRCDLSCFSLCCRR